MPKLVDVLLTAGVQLAVGSTAKRRLCHGDKISTSCQQQ